MQWIKRYVGMSQFPYAIDYHDIFNIPPDIYDWCEQQFGYPMHKYAGDIDKCNWTKTLTGLRFRTEKDQAWFVLKWS